MFTNKKSRLTLLLVAMLASLSAAAAEVSDAWIREAPPGAQMMAAFMTVENPSDKDQVLVGVSSKSFAHMMLHRTVEEDGISKMLHQDTVVIPAHGKVVFKPGDYHVMMPAPAKRLVEGDKVMVSLEFKDGKSQQVEFTVRRAMTMGHGMNHDMHHDMGHDMNHDMQHHNH